MKTISLQHHVAYTFIYIYIYIHVCRKKLKIRITFNRSVRAPKDRIRSCRDQSSWLDLPSDNEAFGPSSFEAHGVTHSFAALFTFERAIQLNIRGQEQPTSLDPDSQIARALSQNVEAR